MWIELPNQKNNEIGRDRGGGEGELVRQGESVRLRKQNLDTLEIWKGTMNIRKDLAKEICDRSNKEDENSWWWFE